MSLCRMPYWLRRRREGENTGLLHVLQAAPRVHTDTVPGSTMKHSIPAEQEEIIHLQEKVHHLRDTTAGNRLEKGKLNVPEENRPRGFILEPSCSTCHLLKGVQEGTQQTRNRCLINRGKHMDMNTHRDIICHGNEHSWKYFPSDCTHITQEWKGISEAQGKHHQHTFWFILDLIFYRCQLILLHCRADLQAVNHLLDLWIQLKRVLSCYCNFLSLGN